MLLGLRYIEFITKEKQNQLAFFRPARMEQIAGKEGFLGDEKGICEKFKNNSKTTH